MKKKDNLIEHIVNNCIEGILIIEDGFITDINDSALEILKYDNKNEILNNLATGILIPNSKEKHIKYNSKIFQEITLITKNGEIIPAIIKIQDIKNKNIKIAYILSLTDLKEKERLLLEQSKLSAMGEMLTMIAHQWRQPLNFLSSVIARLNFKIQTNKLEESFLKNKLDDISKQIQYMSNTIDDFKNFFSKDKIREPSTLNEVTKNAVKIIEKPFLSKNIKIFIEDNKLTTMGLFKNDLIQVILNILNNSKDAIIEKKINDPIILISFDEDEEKQYLFIKDNALGINEEIIKDIFNPYFSTKDSKNGTGLGLYISKMIIEKKFDGEIKIENETNGALCTICLKK